MSLTTMYSADQNTQSVTATVFIKAVTCMYAAIIDEIHRFHVQKLRYAIHPVLYRRGMALRIEYVEYESGYLWYHCLIMRMMDRVDVYFPLFLDPVLVRGHVDHEWAHILWHSGVTRNTYFQRNTEPLRILPPKDLTSIPTSYILGHVVDALDESGRY